MKDFQTPLLLEDRLFKKLEGNLVEVARQRRAHLLNVTRGTTFEALVFFDQDPIPYCFSFTRPPSMLDVASCLAAFDVSCVVREITVRTVKTDQTLISEMAGVA